MHLLMKSSTFDIVARGGCRKSTKKNPLSLVPSTDRSRQPQQVNVKVVSAKNMIAGMKKKRELGAVSTEVLGRCMLSAMLVAHGVKDEETLQLVFNGDGMARGCMAISDGACNVRSWIGNPELEELKDPETGRANVKAAVGRGTLQVVKVRFWLLLLLVVVASVVGGLWD
jgi:hypothetical protein